MQVGIDDSLLLRDNEATEEQLKMNDCYYEKKDWRACKREVSVWVIAQFGLPQHENIIDRRCRWKRSENAGRGRAMKRGQQARSYEDNTPVEF